jgi:uncharacterized protein YicC (UPF0701 family)
MEKSDALGGKETVSIYAHLLELTQKMLELAKQSAWDDLAPIEAQRAQLVARLKRLDDKADNKDISLQKAVLIKQIISLDEETRKLCSEWMMELRSIIDSFDAKKKIKKAYDL